MGEVVRAKTSTGDWCKPTAELPNSELATLLHRARRETPAVIVDKPPVADPPPRERRPRVALQRLTSRFAKLTAPRPVAYPVAPTSYAWVWPGAIALAAAITVALAIVRPF